MNAALILAAGAIGLAGAPHCTAMCGAACGMLTQNCSPRPPAMAAFQGGRLLGYMAGGAIAASSIAAMSLLASLSPALRPLWTVLHLAALALGLWMLAMARMPVWMGSVGRPVLKTTAAPAPGWQRMRGPVRAAAVGTLWVGWPCGLLQSALLVAALADSPWLGAAAMGAFALTSSTGLWLAPALWLRLAGGRATVARAGLSAWSARIAGLSLAAASAWALGHGLWQRALAWCLS